MHARQLPLATAGLVLAGLLLGGCSDGGGADGAATPTPTGTSEVPASPSPSATSDPSDPSPPPEPTVTPATGPELVSEQLRLRVPEGWELDESFTELDVSANGGEGVQGNTVLVTTVPATSGGTLDELAASAAEVPGGRPLEVLEPVTVGGVEMAHVRGPFGGILTDTYVAVVKTAAGTDQVSISFGYDNGVEDDVAFQQALMDEVLATVKWIG